MSFLFGGDDSAEKEAERARADEAARQAKIREGTRRINEIFMGGATRAAGPALAAGAVYDPRKTYYGANGKRFVPTATAGTPATFGTIARLVASPNGTGATSGGSPPMPGTPGKTAAQAFADAVKAGKVYTGNAVSTGSFGGDFFKKRRQSYIDFATPQLADQYGKAGQELTYALSRSGLLDSSARANQEGELTKLYDINKQKVADEALSYETEARTGVEDAKQNLITTLNATGDVQGAVNSAMTRAGALSRPPAYSPLSQLFADFTNALGTQAAQERSFAAGGPTPRYNTGLFSPNKNSVVYG